MYLPILSKKEMAKALNLTPQAINSILIRKDLKNCETITRGRAKYYPSDVARKIFETRFPPYEKRIITFNNLKGGTGKTTISVNLATRLTSYGCKVLFIDLDKQGNSTASLYGSIPEKVLYHAVKGDCTIEDTVLNINEGLDLIPSSLVNQKLENELMSSEINISTYYKNLFGSIVDNYDYVIIDTPADISRSVVMAYMFSTDLVIPVQLDEYCMQGIDYTLDQVSKLRNNFKDFDLSVSVLVNEFDKRKSRSLRYFADINSVEGANLIPAVVRADTEIQEGLTSNFDPAYVLNFSKSKGKEDIDELVRHFLFPEIAEDNHNLFDE